VYIQALENDDGLFQRERKHLLNLLSRLTGSAQVYPKAFELRGVKCDLTSYDDAGAFGAIYKGDLGGRAVCVKAVRIIANDHDTTEKNLKVSVTRSHLCETILKPV
jgi:hypothetical protein